MASKVNFWLLLRLAILLAAFLAQPSEGANYQTFRRQHIDSRPTGTNNLNAYCNRMMQQRGMTRGRCKATNTFIHSSERNVRNICGRGGTPAGRNLFNSRATFNLVICRLTSSRPRCSYRGSRQRRRVRVACVRRLPVHFDGIL